MPSILRMKLLSNRSKAMSGEIGHLLLSTSSTNRLLLLLTVVYYHYHPLQKFDFVLDLKKVLSVDIASPTPLRSVCNARESVYRYSVLLFDPQS